MRIDIVSDVVCPWCIIGYKQLEQALAETDIATEIHWHPFELNPTMPADGENLREHLAAKYGTTLEESKKARTKLTALGAELGFTFNYADDMRMVNTFRAHQVIHWAGNQGKAHSMKMALFTAFFTYRRDLNDPQVLANAAAEIGLDHDQTLDVILSERYAQIVRDTEKQWIMRDIHGVPAMIFAERYLLSGAQGVENYKLVLQQVLNDQAA
ncbi:MAG: DsbA family oxidoreductase [Filomicrobium sp.]